LWDQAVKQAKLARLLWRVLRFRYQLKRDPAAASYMDVALTPVRPEEIEELELFAIHPTSD
jgi:hypothetical protein